jgi:hypothetical protein
MDRQKIIVALETLRDYNRWRRGQLKVMPNATLIGESIELVIDLISTEILNKK